VSGVASPTLGADNALKYTHVGAWDLTPEGATYLDVSYGGIVTASTWRADTPVS